MVSLRTYRPFVLTIGSGVLLASAFYVPHAWFLIFVALVPFFHAVRHASLWQAFALGTMLGAIIVGTTTSWMFAALPQPALSGMPGLQLLLIFVSWAIIIIFMAPCVGVFAILMRTVRADTWRTSVLLAIAWVFLEAGRLYGFAIATYAPGIDNPPFFSVGFLGYPLADSVTYLQLASLGGIWLMSFVAFMANIAFFRASLLRRRAALRASGALAAGLVLITCLPVASWREYADTPASRTLTVAVLSSYLPPSVRVGTYKLTDVYGTQMDNFVAWAATMEPDVILLPEGSRFLQASAHGVPQPNEPLVLDSWATNFAGAVSMGYAGSVNGTTFGPVRAKSMLTPQGEYVMYAFILGGKLLGMEDELRAATHALSLTSESWGRAVDIPGTGIRASLLFCIEMMGPGLGKELVAHEKSDVLLFMMSHGSFHPIATLRRDTLRFLQVQAAEAGVPLVASGDETPAYALDRYGRVIASYGKTGEGEYGIVTLPI